MLTSNRITLDRALADELVALQGNVRENTIAMAMKAFEIRSQYLSEDGRRYDEAFEKWWASFNLDSIFGKRANFTKYAAAGEALEKAKVGEYRDRLPLTLTALYEVSQLTPDELKLSVQDTFSRDSLTDTPKGRQKPTPVVHPEATAAEIKSWRKRWRSPKPKSTEKRRLPYATIKAHGSLYDTDKKPKGAVVLTVETLKEIDAALINAMKPFDEFVLLETRLERLIEGQQKRQEAAQERERKSSAEKKRKKSRR
jgi:hypothetical protein